MYVAVNVLMSIIVLLFVVSGILIRSKRYNWLTPGTMEQVHDGTVDTTGLGNFIGNFFFVIAGTLLVAGIFNHFHIFYGLVFSIAFLFFLVAFMLIRTQKYNRSILPSGKRKTSAKVILGIIVAALVIIGGMLIYGSIEQSVDVDKDKMEIGGLYGASLDMDGAAKVSMIRELPKIQTKTNGFDFANVLKGNFRLDGLGEGKLYVNVNTPLFIEIKLKDSFVILNFKDSTATKAVYEKMKQYWEAE
ncbi:MAG TPA: DUF3784 domain-containing protein [Candidatus Acidoferrales bacterium]|nr:DUF3784 domain-containing protein [Candidatus Acidoferrales bacterium]